MSVNPKVKVYTPGEGAAFGTPTGPGLLKLIRRKVDSVPDELRYFDGEPPAKMVAGTPWPSAQFSQIRDVTEVIPGFFLFSNQSDVTGTKEMNEISMAIKTPKGIVVIVGCSHPGIEKILASASKVDTQIHAVFGGFHLVDIPDAEVTRMATAFKDKWKIERMAPGHCTGQFAFAEFIRVYGADFDRAGLGSVIALPL